MHFKKIISIFSCLSFLLLSTYSYAQTPPASQTAGAQIRQEVDLNRSRYLEDRVRSEKKKETEEIGPESLQDDVGEKVLISKITVEGATLISESAIQKIIARFEGKELSMKGMQMCADLITDEYRTSGYATSRAYIPPQTLKDGLLIIRVVEGRLGKVDVRGNKYFKTSLYEKHMDAETNGYFDYEKMQDSITYINEHPDRNSRVVLAPGTEPGTTDLILEVEDRLPVHIGFNYDNYLSQYYGERRWTGFIDHNNLLGFGDKLRIQYQSSRTNSQYNLFSTRYLFPVNQKLETGAYFAKGKSKLGREFKDLGAYGESLLWGMFFNQELVSNGTLDLRMTGGFDYKNNENYLLGTRTSFDKARVAKLGFDVDINDPWARNIFTMEYDIGIPHIMEGMKSKDPNSSRGASGSGGKFQKFVFNYFRLQPMPFSSDLLWKTSAQTSNHNLIAGEQFQLGGPQSVRGYGLGEKAGDKGIYSSFEWTFPVYGLPKSWRVPFMKERTLYESIRILGFYDWGEVHTKTPSAGQKKHETLRAAGPGLRLNFGENLFVRVEFGYPLHSGNKNPTDSKNVHPWFEINAKF